MNTRSSLAAKVRAEGREPDARVPRRRALCAPRLCRRFALECAALRRVRQDMGLTNLRIMVPFCRRVEEARRVLEAMASHGLKRGENGLEIYVMCEIPNNVIQIDAFAELFDGFSIGSNDLTQLTLGVDRDSEIVAFDFDERDPGMLEMLRLAVLAPSATDATSAFAAKRRPTIRKSLAILPSSASTSSASILPASCERCRWSARRSLAPGQPARHPWRPSKLPQMENATAVVR